MLRVPKQSMLQRFLSSGVVAVAIVASASVSLPAEGQDSQPPSAFDIADGMRLDQQKGNCKAYPTRMPDPPATLQPREIDLIVDFLMAKIVGKGQMDHAKCVEFWGSDPDACKEFPK